MKKRLTPKQCEIVQLMQSGWELAKSLSGGREWLQKGGAGSGGEVKRLRVGTVAALVSKGWAAPNKYRFPTQTYSLTQDPAQ